ncbi:MAG: hypothetical protein JSS75_11000 [Bacteroidetes bacterium]|nr:hypothetical protein [Bacteroidota bacterium]
MGSVVTGTQPASAFTGITVTMGANVYTVAFGGSIPAASGLKLSWAQNGDASEVIFTDQNVVGEH